METPFDNIKTSVNQYFVGRKEELSRLSADFSFMTNTVVISPQGWGKTSLVSKAAEIASARDPKLRFCFVDMFNIRVEEDFYVSLLQNVIKSVSSGVEDAVGLFSSVFAEVKPRIEFGAGLPDLRIGLDRDTVRRYRDLILDLPQKLADERDVKLVVCVDDFHMAELFDDTDDFLHRLDTRWAAHEKAAYCLCSSPNGMVEKFAEKSISFHIYGQVMNLGKMDEKDLVTMLRDRFMDSGKYLDDEKALMMIELAGGCPYYVHQIANLSWMRTSVVCSEDVIYESHASLVDQSSLVFAMLTAGLTEQQVCYLRAVVSGETVISSAEVLHRHNITSATSASRSKAALLHKGIVCNVGDRVSVTDPIYAYWLKHKYFDI